MLTATVAKKLFALLLSLFLTLGVIAGPSTADPIVLKDEENAQLAFAAISDIHINADSFRAYRLSNVFTDVKNSGVDMDALVIAGDLVDNGLGCEFKACFDVLDNQDTFDKVLIASGNHDARNFYERNNKLITDEINKLLDIDTEGKPYYSYKMDGGVFIVLGTERQEFERAYLSDTQLQFLDDELTKAQAEDLPAFVICHQPLKNTHGLPDVWKTGDLGDQSEQVREILTSHENVIFINGHLHDGYYEKSVCELSEGVYSVNLPTYTKENDFGKTGKYVGYIVEVYDDEVTFSMRNFAKGENVDVTFSLALV